MQFGHPTSHGLDRHKLARLADEYEAKGIDFVISLDIQWDLETDYGKFHDVSGRERKAGFVLRYLYRNQIAGCLHNAKGFAPEIFWKCSDHIREKSAGVIFSILNGIPLTPPLLIADKACDCLFINSGHNRFGVGIMNHFEEIPILIRKPEAEVFDGIVGRKA